MGRLLLLLSVASLASACGDSVGEGDLGQTHADAFVRDLGPGPRDATSDAGSPRDAGEDEDGAAGTDGPRDMGPPPDATIDPDATVDPDASIDPDATVEPDASVGPDASEDASVSPDAEVDAGPSLDADVDAGFPADAEADAGAPPDAAPDAGFDPDGGGSSICAIPPSPSMSFFVTEAGNLSGDFGGLAGADQRCAQLAIAAGITGRTWVAYLSALNDATYGRVDAVDRIGGGPWFNHAGVNIGTNAQIHGAAGVPAPAILTECGRLVEFDANDFGGDPGAHDIFTGSTSQGRLEYYLANPALGPATCGDWTSSLPTNFAIIGHSDWNPGDSWNAAHFTTGCDEASLRSTAANGRIYCFATD